MKKGNQLLLLIAFIVIACKNPQPEENQNSSEAAPAYQADWESLSKHNEEPAWFQDGKLGIYFHWGVYSVPAFGNEWYPRWMHYEDTKEYQHHLATYGHPSEFGYHDFVPMFTAENFDPEAWADLFQRAGAKFAGPVAEHHDGFSMWASDITPWNARDKGPKRDITGELGEALKKRDLRLITTFHHARNLQRYDSIAEESSRTYWSSHYPFLNGMPPSSDDPDLKYLYGNIPADEWLEKVWLGKVNEVVDKYQPDIIWFDSWLDRIPEKYRQEMAAYYLNRADEWGKEVVIVRKQDDLPLDFSVDDLEKSRKNRLEEKVWMTDETISKGSWCYTEDLQIKETKDVLHVLVDIVSKNGVLLLNISPMKDGTIPENQREVLLGMGQWLDQYGEAIYSTRPWYTYGEGPTKEPEGHFKNNKEFLKIKYSGKDIRYTTRENIIYATLLGQQEDKQVLLKSFAENSLPTPVEIANVSLLGSTEKVTWELQDQGLLLNSSSTKSDEMAPVYKIELKD